MVAKFLKGSQGMRLNATGELLLHHIRVQKSDLARLKSQIADLSGMRRGHVSIACSQALIPFFFQKKFLIIGWIIQE